MRAAVLILFLCLPSLAPAQPLLDDRAVPGLPTVQGLDSFGQDAAGRVYVVSQGGPIYRFAAR